MFITTSPWLFQTDYISIHIYGLCIAVGLSISLWNIIRDPILKQYNLLEDATKIITYAVLWGWLGARLLWILEYWDEVSWIDFVTLTTPGYSLLGGVIGVGGVVIWVMKDVHASQRLLLADRLSLYAPLVIGFGRIGCFFTGCCYGIETNVPWKICYAHTDVVAPLDIFIHPVQLYSAGLLFLLFSFLYYMQNRMKTGRVFAFSVQGIFFERFVVDFFRDSRTVILSSLSLHQMIAGVGIITLIMWYVYKKRDINH